MHARLAKIALRPLLCGVALSTLALAAPARAGDAAESPPAAQEPEPSGDIIVTASRREEQAKDVPVAVSAISGDKLDVLNSSGLDIRFLSSRVPSLQIESSFGRTFPRFYIRGLGNTDFDPNAAQPVSVVYDDVALESPMLKSFPVFDLASVQVLRGPQGTLFGRNTPAGVVKLDSTKPGETISGKVSGSLATYNSINVEAGVGGPLGGGFAYRVSGLIQHRDDWVKNVSTSPLSVASKELEGYTDIAGRLLLSYTDGPFDALLNVHVRDLDGTPRVFRAGLFRQGSNEFSAGFDPEKAQLDGYTNQTLSQWGANLHLDYHFDGAGTLSSITALEQADVTSTGDIDGGDNYTFPALGLNNALFPSNTGGVTKPEEFSQELRFVSDDLGGYRLQGGLYYFQQTLSYTELSFPLGGGASTQFIFHDNTNENIGAYLSGEVNATDALTLRGGLRYSHDDKSDTITTTTPGATTGGLAFPLTTKAKGGAVTWDLSATYALSDAINVYARVATGYLAPAIQDRVTFGSVPTVASKQSTISVEGGVKGGLGDGVNFALTGYYWRTEDLQLTAVGGGANSARLINAEAAVGYGLEAEFAARPLPGLAFTASGSYNFTELRSPGLNVFVCGSACTVTDPTFTDASGTHAIIDGNDLPQAPRWVANATLRYGVPIGDGELFFFTDWAYRSEINYFLYDAKEFRGRSLLEGGLKIGYAFEDGLELSGFARNITNQIRSISAIDFNNLTGMINEPRIIGGEVRYSF
jgi:iron complex outermembrane receptor protein